jgi:hypothetical protein
MGTHRVRLTKVTALPRKTQTQWKQRDIRSPSFMDAALTVEWLNASKGTTAYRHVLALRTELEALRVELDKPFQPIHWETAERPTAQSAEHLQRLNKIADRHRQLNLLLGKYTFKNQMAYHLNPPRWWLTMLPKNPRGPQIEIENSIGFPKIRVTEAWVAAALARLAASRQLPTVHLCENCQERWHVALRSIDRFCSDECREHFHTHSDAYRERKRNSQREYRASPGYRLDHAPGARAQKKRRKHGTR